MPKIEIDIECPSCHGTGIYVGLAEKDREGVICQTCNGTGKKEYSFSYKKFTGRKTRENVKRVYKQNYGFCIAPRKINFKDIEKFVCPMLADQATCHKIKGFIDECEKLHGSSL